MINKNIFELAFNLCKNQDIFHDLSGGDVQDIEHYEKYFLHALEAYIEDSDKGFNRYIFKIRCMTHISDDEKDTIINLDEVMFKMILLYHEIYDSFSKIEAKLINDNISLKTELITKDLVYKKEIDRLNEQMVSIKADFAVSSGIKKEF